ncbi:MAG TPA: RDD family protein [Chitinophagaceae bacterium]|nr:RDD family protein [Chitinophagaceae bacterium]
MSIIQISTPFNIDLEFEIAEFHKRLFAYLIDFFILLIYLVIMKNLYYGRFENLSRGNIESHIGIDILSISLPMLLYSLVSELLMHGQSIGKKIMKIRVISLEGGEPTLGQYLIRWMFRAWEWPFLFGYVFFSTGSLIAYTLITGFFGIIVVIIIGVSKKSQRLGDLAANTAVVNTKSKLSVHDTVFMEISQPDYQVKFPEVLKLTDRDINTIKNVVNHFYKIHNADTAVRVARKVQDVLKVSTDMYAIDFLEKLLADYNYLATKE